MKSAFLSLTITLFGVFPVMAQAQTVTELTLQKCLQIAVDNNITMQSARIEQEKSSYKVSETRAALLPKITLNGAFQDNLKLATTLLPGEIVGRPGTSIPVQMGTNYSANAALTVNQVLYNQTAITALHLSEKMEALNVLSVEKATEELALEVSKLYFLAVTTAKQKTLIEENIVRTQHLGDIVKLRVANGMGKKVDFERVSVNLENLNTQLSNTQAMSEQQLNLIKYMLDLPLGDSIVLTDSTEMNLMMQNPDLKSDFANHIDIRMLESQKEIKRANQKLITNAYIPTLSFVGQYAYQGLRNDFKNYFQNSTENKWYASSYIGLNLSMPLFDGLEKHAKLRQARLDYQKTEMQLDNTKKSLTVNYQNALNNFENQKNIVQRQQQNITLAEDVYKETALKYREGLATMSELLQDEMGLNNAQAGYVNALYNYKDCELKVIALRGEIKNLINK